MLKAHERLAALGAMSLAIAGCAADPVLDPKPAPAVIIGWENTPQDQMLAELIGGSLARAGTVVRVEPSGHDAEGVSAALDSNAITLAPSFIPDPDPRSPDRGEEATAAGRAPEKVCATVSRQQPQGIAISDCAETAWSSDAGEARYVLARYRSGGLLETQLRRVNLVLGTITPSELTELTRRVAQGQSVAGVARNWLDAHGV